MLALCDVVDSAFQPVAEAPREVLRHQVNQLAERGLIAQVATELEFYAFRESFESAHSKKFIGLVPFFHRQGDHDVLVTDVYDEFLRDVRQAMTSMAVTPLAVLGEGGLGQVEMNFPHDEPLLVADRHVLFKHAVRALAQRHGHSVTFMAKYDVAEPGSSCHVHLSLWQHDGTSASESGALRGPLRDFLAGLLEFLPDFQLAFTPNPNSFSRLAPGSWAPVTRTWGFDNRTVMVRVLGDGVTRRLEFRLPGADANPYIALAGILAAGIAGLDDKPDLPEPSRGDAYSQNDRATVHRKLGDAIRAFDASARAADAFGKDVHQHLVLRANAGDDARTAAVTDWDRSQGFESF
ncbi:glutamine synthetase family protein [Mycobacterium antarcticum]|uniref:glutamine synthetase family protein n=1 Tax=Mycolicibacterium sp. TUM20984 TaxID=3023368 RepID=UPI0024E0E0B4|nr:glutamine synthetase [Mycolicibacterium sp. TUM20984]